MSYCVNKLKDNPAIGASRPKLWRAMALAFTTGRLALASSLMQPLMVSYNTPLTQNELLKIATNRLAIDEALAAAGNHNGAALVEDYVVLGEALEDFSLGPARNLKKAKACLNKATLLSTAEENRTDHFVLARVYFYQARCAQERKTTPAMVENFLNLTAKELRRINYRYSDKEEVHAAVDVLTKKVKELQQECERTRPN
jgi:hypothetical protein